jgi:hypothetical protein
VDDVGVGELVPEEAEARHLGREPIAVGLNLQDLDLEDVAGLGIVDVYRAGQRMDHVEVGRADRLSGGLRAELSVQAVPRLQDNLIARVAAHDRRDVRMPAVMAGLRLLGQRLRPVDPHLVRGHRPPPLVDDLGREAAAAGNISQSCQSSGAGDQRGGTSA